MPKTYVLDLPGGMTQRGFWLYVWRVPNEDKGDLHYVGRTGDNSSPYAAAVYRRMGQHLGDASNTNALLTHLRAACPERDIWEFKTFQMISYGPIFPEVERHREFKHGAPPHYREAFERHKPYRDRVAALEAKLAHELDRVGYRVLNKVNNLAALNANDWVPVCKAFAEHFDKLGPAAP